MSYPGAAPPPPGVAADIDDPQDVLRTVNYVTQALTLLFTTAFVVTRFYAKSQILGGGVTVDDYATYTAYILMVGYCITAVFASSHGGGLNQWEVRKEDIQPFFQSGYAVTLFYAPMALTVKLALLVIIIRVFGTVHKKTLIGVYVLIGLLVVYYVSGFFIKLFICWPISAYWRGEHDKCMNQSAVITSDAIISMLSDLIILLLPTPLTWSLQLPRRQRLRVSGLLCAGGIATAFSVYRLALIVRERNSTNQTIVFTQVLLSGNAEAGIGLICACFPAVNALYVQKTRGSSYFKQSRSRQASSKQTQSHGGEIMLTRTFHVDTSSANYESQSIGNDESELVSKQPHITIGDKRDLKSLCEASKALYVLAAARLYGTHEVLLRAPDEHYLDEVEVEGLLRAAERSSDLRARVTNLRISAPFSERLRLRCVHDDVDDEEVHMTMDHDDNGQDRSSLQLLGSRILPILQKLQDGRLQKFSWDMGVCVPQQLLGQRGYVLTHQSRIQHLRLVTDYGRL
ncbi:hypothetical protein VFPPC_11451 [Pochonia chlamydosporia 170]|uniref:Rhodopsin domain-containing protein n=1 Tax=Pochonia chlamydosporia 170 TaxID=1380566 RepID=A0A179EVS8_METCM|nr:hypothetical protein VFPPC_11451 [Pochonia chlamydosporia 170]OAQ57298.1 hypothetical protein VFPPC_11451 [Pochonia chlamydosporia 170]